MKRYAMILMLICATAMAGCVTLKLQTGRIPDPPAKPEIDPVPREKDKGFCLDEDDAVLFLEYVRDLEEGYE